jgi:hypothetical protein
MVLGNRHISEEKNNDVSYISHSTKLLYFIEM